MELILDDGDERAVGVETKVLLRSGDAYLVPRGVWHGSNRSSPATSSMSHPTRMGAIDRVIG